MATAQSPQAHRRSSEILMLEPDDLQTLSTFLRGCFDAPHTARFASTDMLAWKYLAASADTTSYVVKRGGRIVAHAGVLRATMRGARGASVECATIIDWAAASDAPGAGLALYRHAMHQAQATFLIGGTLATQQLAGRLGFRPAMVTHVHSRWVRPLREFLLRPRTSRSWLRLAHGIASAPFRRLAPRRGWSIEPAHRFDSTVRPLLASATAPHSSAHRSVETLNHRLACPGRSMRGHVLRRRGEVAGIAVSSVGDWDAKILLVQLASADVRDWSAAYGLVTAALAREPRVCRVSLVASSPDAERAAGANHFWRGTTYPVLFHDPDDCLTALQPIEISYFDTDLDYYNA